MLQALNVDIQLRNLLQALLSYTGMMCAHPIHVHSKRSQAFPDRSSQGQSFRPLRVPQGDPNLLSLPTYRQHRHRSVFFVSGPTCRKPHKPRRHQTCYFRKPATSAPAEFGWTIPNVSRNRARTQVSAGAEVARLWKWHVWCLRENSHLQGPSVKHACLAQPLTSKDPPRCKARPI